MILIVAEHAQGRPRPIHREMVVLGRKMAADLGRELVVAILGSENSPQMVARCGLPGVDRILSLEDEKLARYSADAWVAALAGLISDTSPFFVLAGHTSVGYDFLPRLAARLHRPLVAGCIDYEQQGDRLVLTRPIFNARLHMRLGLRGDPPYFVTLAPGAFPSTELTETEDVIDSRANPPTVESVTVDLSGVQIRASFVELKESAKGTLDLGSAEIIVAGGRGLKGKENLKLIQDLAEAVGGAVGASRPVVDSEWLPREYQIGSSGQTVSPKLYFAIGISGAVQHLVGMQSSRCIVAINKDADAPIFKVAHYGIVDDLLKVVPEITKTIRALKRSGP